MKKTLFGYSIREVEDELMKYRDLVDIQKKDIMYLKQDNADLKNTLFELSTELAKIEKQSK